MAANPPPPAGSMTDFEFYSNQIKDGTWDERRRACAQLVQLGDAEAVHPLIYALDDQDASVREAAYNALGELNHPLAATPIVTHLERETEEPVRLAALRALGKLRDVNTISIITTLLKDDQATIRQYAAEALGQIRDKRAIEDLTGCLDDKNLHVRAAACESLGMLKHGTAIRPLIQKLGDPAPLVREKALEALRRLGEYQLVTAYALAFFGSETDATVFNMLASQGDVRIVSALIERMEHPWTEPARKTLIAKILNLIHEPSSNAIGRIFCAQDLTRFEQQTKNIQGVGKVKYVACRTCESTLHAIPASTATAMLDETMEPKWRFDNGAFLVNWFHYNTIFDFNRVAIGQADDEAVTRFCLEASNDTDPKRPQRCYDMVCEVLPHATISPNTLQILKRTFAMVKDRRR